MLDDEDEPVVQEKVLEESALIQTDIKDAEIIDKIVKYANEAFENAPSDKQIATNLKKLLDSDKSLNIPSNPQGVPNYDEQGVWQCIIGRQFCASVAFDAELLIYFVFPKLNKYFLVFRS